MRLFILPYSMASKSSKLLAQELNAIRIYPDRRYKSRPDHLIINWGYSGTPSVPINKATILNHPSQIKYVSDKLNFFRFQGQSPKVIHTEDKETAKQWAQGDRIYCRTLVQGKGGKGIVIANSPNEIVDAPLYTEYMKGKEYRIHVFMGGAILIQQKRKMSEEKLSEEKLTFNSEIKNHNNGWVFAINSVDEPSLNTIKNALQCVKEYGLDFGAVDIIETERKDSYVLEINSAPGLEGTTLTKYVEAIKNYIGAL